MVQFSSDASPGRFGRSPLPPPRGPSLPRGPPLPRGDPHDFVNLTFKLSGKTENHLRISIKEMNCIFEAFLISYLEETHMHDSKSDFEKQVEKITDRLVRKTRNFLIESQLELLREHASVDR